MPSIYLAGPWARRPDVRAARDKFVAAGINVPSRWIDFEPDPNEDSSQVHAREAEHDLDDIEHADLFVVLNLEKSEGKAFETGYALAIGRKVIVVGKPLLNVFQHMPYLLKYDTVEEAIAYIKSIY